jgi:outer membrane protein OmpA-like peptidoglycan-associated protein
MKRGFIAIAAAAMVLAGAARAVEASGAHSDTGASGITGEWTSFRSFDFAYNDDRILKSDAAQSEDIATYLQANPSLDLGLDGRMDPRGSDPKDQALTDRRVASVRVALIAAGVAPGRIKIGAFGDPQNRRDRRVEVLFATTD